MRLPETSPAVVVHATDDLRIDDIDYVALVKQLSRS